MKAAVVSVAESVSVAVFQGCGFQDSLKKW
jgi:hypothetical protein